MNTSPVMTPWDVAPKTGPEPTSTVTDETHEWTEEEAEAALLAMMKADQLAAKRRYEAYRKRTRFFRRVWGGIALDQRLVMKHGDDARRALVADGRKVYGYVDFNLGGVEDVVSIAQGLGMKRGRVRLVLKLVKRGDVR